LEDVLCGRVCWRKSHRKADCGVEEGSAGGGEDAPEERRFRGCCDGMLRCRDKPQLWCPRRSSEDLGFLEKEWLW
jgi:hypothetical protein